MVSATRRGAEPSCNDCSSFNPHRDFGRLLSNSHNESCRSHQRSVPTLPFQDGSDFLSPVIAVTRAFIITSSLSAFSWIGLTTGALPNISKTLWTLGAGGGIADASKWLRAEAAVIEGHPARPQLLEPGCAAAFTVTFAPCIAEGIALAFVGEDGIPFPGISFPDIFCIGSFPENFEMQNSFEENSNQHASVKH